MKKLILMLVATSALLFSAPSSALNLTPALCIAGTCETGTETSTAIINAYIESTYGVTEMYKLDVAENAESGAFANSYETTVNAGLSDATLTWNTGTNSMLCPSCYLLVKDGAHQPAWYLFDITTWSGMETITMSGFWPEGGAISHISLFNDGSQTVPEPGILALMGIGLFGMVAYRRKQKV